MICSIKTTITNYTNNFIGDHKERIKNIAIMAIKISVVAAAVIALLATSFALATFMVPLIAARTFKSIVGGIAVGGAAIGVCISGFLAPLWGGDHNFGFIAPDDTSPMYKVTDNNARDCLLYIGKTLGQGIAWGAGGAILAPGSAPLWIPIGFVVVWIPFELLRIINVMTR